MPIVPQAESRFDVAIIGGGTAGALVAIHLLREGGVVPRIAIVEPRAALAAGVAYSTAFPEHLLNVVASRMSAFDDDPGHFVRFLAATADGADGADEATIGAGFARRMDYGRYLRSTLEVAARGAQVEWIRDEAVDLHPGDGGGHRVALASGGRLQAVHVVLAIGNEARAFPHEASASAPLPAIVAAWDYGAVRGIDPGADVCIIGSGLSMVDAVMSLAANAHRGRITVLSRHGLAPLPHAAPAPVAQRDDIDALLASGMRARLRRLRASARAHAGAGQPWQWTMDAVRQHVQALWRRSDDAERRRFLRHAVRYWDIHRHRIAPAAAARLQQLRASGQLRLRAGRLHALAEEGGRPGVHLQLRGTGHGEWINADCVINATGVETRLARSRRPLARALRKRGIAQPGPQGIGLATDDEGSLIDATGRPVAGLWTLGASRIGQLWESIAIPELRAQARSLAQRLREPLPSDPPPPR